MQFSELYKIGSGKPVHTDIPKGGLAIDVVGEKAYSKNSKGDIFPLGIGLQDILDAIKASSAIVPIGGIIAYSGALNAIPVGWAICDGTNGTPNLNNNFIMGTNDQSRVHHTGGSRHAVVVRHKHVITPHKHTASTGNDGGEHRHTYNKPYYRNDSFGRSNASSKKITDYKEGLTATTGKHGHQISVSDTTASMNDVGTSATDKNLPPYIMLAYIMRKK